MLKAFDYLEPTSNSLYNQNHFEKELELSQMIIRNLNTSNHTEIICPACGGKHNILFFKKWGISYFRCSDCETIFLPVNEDILIQYNKDLRLQNFLISEEYQLEASNLRNLIWQENINWISFRTFRYLGHNTNLDIIDFGNRYEGFIHQIKESSICGHYTLVDSILSNKTEKKQSIQQSDIILHFNQMQGVLHPLKELSKLYNSLKPGGLLFFSTRMGTGFDILTLKQYSKIFPYEHIFLPSYKALEELFKLAGFKILEYSTPGQTDVNVVRLDVEHINVDNYFIHSLIKNSDIQILSEFQRFLQKSGMSSYGQIVAQKVGE